MSKKWYDLSELKKHHINYYAQAGEESAGEETKKDDA